MSSPKPRKRLTPSQRDTLIDSKYGGVHGKINPSAAWDRVSIEQEFFINGTARYYEIDPAKILLVGKTELMAMAQFQDKTKRTFSPVEDRTAHYEKLCRARRTKKAVRDLQTELRLSEEHGLPASIFDELYDN